MTIRPARLEDAAEIARTHVASWHETYTGMVPAAMLSSLSVEARTAMWKQILATPAAPGSPAVYVSEMDRKVVGFGSCGAQRTQALREKGYDGEITALYVLKAFQRCGIGRGLLYAMASDLGGRGYAAASLWVLRDNMPARRFYERCGGEVVSEKEDARPDGVLVEVAYGWMDLTELVLHMPR